MKRKSFLRKTISLFLVLTLMVTSTSIFAQEPTKKKQPVDSNYNIASLRPVDYALLATDDGGVDVESAIATINANVYSGGNFTYSGSQLTLNGECNVVGKIIKNTSYAMIEKENENVTPLQMENHISAIKEILSADADVIEGDIAITSPTKDSIVNGNLTISNASLNLCSKIVTKDDIVIDSSMISSAEDNPFILASEDGNINITASYSILNGFIYAPNGTVKINSSIANMSGIIIAKEIIINSSSCTVTNNSICTDWLNDFDPDIPEIIDQADLEKLISDGTIEVIRGADGSFRTIDGKFTNKRVKSASDAADVLNSASSLFGERFKANASEITIESLEFGEAISKQSFYRYSPLVNGVPVSGSQMVLATNGNGVVSGLFSTYSKRLTSVNTNPTITEQQAIDAAINKVLTDEETDAYLHDLAVGSDYETVKAEFLSTLSTDAGLLVYDGSDDSTPVLAWAVELSNQTISDDEENEDTTEPELLIMPNVSETVYISANGSLAGKELFAIPNQMGMKAKDLKGDDRDIEVTEKNGKYQLIDPNRKIKTYKATTKLPGKLIKFTDVAELDPSAVSAHANVAVAFDYYKDVLYRNSYDNKGSDVNVNIDYRQNNKEYDGALWEDELKQIAFGDVGKNQRALDVVAHEFTHAVIYSIGGSDKVKPILEYKGEPGALNESYADIMGTLIENKNDDGRWLLGEDRDGYAYRSMRYPSLSHDPQPEHYDDLDLSNREDQYGVHKNNGIFNLAAYKMMTDERTGAISSEEWARIFYCSLYRLSTNSKFLDARGAIESMARIFEFTNQQRMAIKDAFDAVGIKEKDSFRIVLKWGSGAEDLDSHLVGPMLNDEKRLHVYYEYPTYYIEKNDILIPIADLDYDFLYPNGTEIITMHTLKPGEYYYYVHDYTNSLKTSSDFSKSQATVQVYNGSSGTPINTYSVSTSKKGNLWGVFKLTIDVNGKYTISSIDNYSYERDPSSIGTQ